MSLRPFVLVDAPLHDAAPGTTVALSDADVRHLRTVLRLRPGAEVELADGRGAVAPARLDTTGAIVTDVPHVEPAAATPLVLAQALPKARKLDEVVRQVTELGVDLIVPLEAARSVARLADEAKRLAARERWQAVARAACAQARRAWVPEVTAAVPVAELGTQLDARFAASTVLVAHPGGEGPRAAAPGLDGAVAVAVGPEGGWTDAEVELLCASGGRRLGLGRTVLRTEHAGAAAVAAVAAVLGRFELAPTTPA